MMKTFFTTLILLIAFGATAGPAMRTHPEKATLQGKVKTIRTSGYGTVADNQAPAISFNKDFYSVDSYSTDGLIQYTHRIKFGEQSGWTEYKYDNTGNKIEERTYDKETQTVQLLISKYDTAGNKTTERTYNKKGQLIQLLLLQYDTTGNVAQEIYPLNDNLHIIYLYDNGMPVMKKHVLPPTKYRHNDRGKFTKEVPNPYHPDSITATRYAYNDKGLVTSENATYNNKNVITTYYTYDTHNNPVLTKEVDKAGKTIRSISTQYTYDKQGNWIRCIEDEPDDISNNEQKKGIHIREIEYY